MRRTNIFAIISTFLVVILFSSCSNILMKILSVGPKCTVTFVANGGSGTMKAQEFTKNVSQKLDENEFYNYDYSWTYGRINFDFEGWSTNQYSPEVEYTDQEEITIDDDITLYAVWEYKVTSKN